MFISMRLYIALMKVFIEKDDRTQELDFEGSVSELLERLSINPQTVIVTRGKELLTADDNISAGDSLRILSVVSGG